MPLLKMNLHCSLICQVQTKLDWQIKPSIIVMTVIKISVFPVFLSHTTGEAFYTETLLNDLDSSFSRGVGAGPLF